MKHFQAYFTWKEEQAELLLLPLQRHSFCGIRSLQVKRHQWKKAGLGLIWTPPSSLHLLRRSNKPAWGITRQIGNMENLQLNLCSDITFLCCNGENWTYWIAHHTDMEFWKPLLLHKCWQDILFTASLKVKETHSLEDSFFQLLISIKANFGSNLMINIKYGKSSNWAFLFITPILLYCWGTL